MCSSVLSGWLTDRTVRGVSFGLAFPQVCIHDNGAKKTEKELHLPSDAKNCNPILPTEDRGAGRGFQTLYAPYLPGVHGDTCS